MMTVAEQQRKPNSIMLLTESLHRSDYNCSRVGILTFCKMLIMMYQTPKEYGVKEVSFSLAFCFQGVILHVFDFDLFDVEFLTLVICK